MTRPSRVLSAPSGKHQALALWLRDSPPQLSRPLNPELHSVIDVSQCGFLIVAMRHTPGQFRHLGYERLIFVAPVGLRLSALALQVDYFHDAFPVKKMVTAPNSLRKAKAQERAPSYLHC